MRTTAETDIRHRTCRGRTPSDRTDSILSPDPSGRIRQGELFGQPGDTEQHDRPHCGPIFRRPLAYLNRGGICRKCPRVMAPKTAALERSSPALKGPNLLDGALEGQATLRLRVPSGLEGQHQTAAQGHQWPSTEPASPRDGRRRFFLWRIDLDCSGGYRFRSLREGFRSVFGHGGR